MRRLSMGSVVMCLFVAACSGSETQDEAPLEEGALSGAAAPTADGVSFSYRNVSAKLPARTQPSPAELADVSDPEEKEARTHCLLDYDVIEVKGTRFDAQVNSLLAEGAPKLSNFVCEEPMSMHNVPAIRLAAKGVVSVRNTYDEFYQGNAYPDQQMRYRSVDLQTGKVITLADLVQPSAVATIVSAIKRKIATQKMEWVDERGASKMIPLTKDERDTLNRAADGLFTGREGTKKLADVKTFAIVPTGIEFDLSNELPHAAVGLAESSYLVPFTLLKGKLVSNDVTKRLTKK